MQAGNRMCLWDTGLGHPQKTYTPWKYISHVMQIINGEMSELRQRILSCL
ncbi:MAG: hypothetical protein JWN70_1710 [Planctomycetaceae bacterium]|nr:hypothetical protein [Planctomycetaceae bacterium]